MFLKKSFIKITFFLSLQKRTEHSPFQKLKNKKKNANFQLMVEYKSKNVNRAKNSTKFWNLETYYSSLDSNPLMTYLI
jgi:hypothetical protein